MRKTLRGVAAIAALGLAMTGCSGELEDITESSTDTSPNAQVEGPQQPAEPGSEDAASAQEHLNNLRVVTLDEQHEQAAQHDKYNRKQKFGPTWPTLDQGCDARNVVLDRDLHDVSKKSDGCTVLSGTLDDPYTGNTIDFQRGKDTSRAVQVDHKVALSEIYESGAWDWTQDQREEYANNPENLMAVDGPANNSKSDKDAAGWLPENDSYRCQYIFDQIDVKDRYGLSVDEKEKASLEQNLSTC